METQGKSRLIRPPADDCDSAKILINEGMTEEAKKLLFRLLAKHPNYEPAKKILNEIEQIELKEIFNSSKRVSSNAQTQTENVDQLIAALERDLGLNPNGGSAASFFHEVFLETPELSAKEYLDLAIGFIEMDCHSDALRELLKAEKLIRRQETFLGEVGIATVSLIAQCLVKLDRAYEAKEFLSPVLTEADLAHENKTILYYEMGCIEQELGNHNEAMQWFKNVLKTDPLFKDIQYRLKILIQKNDT